MKLQVGFARFDSSTQRFLDTCAAVKDYVVTADGHFCIFRYDPRAEVSLVPARIWFERERAGIDECAALAASLIHHEIDRLSESDLCATKEEIEALHEIFIAEGFGGREEASTFDQARSVATNRLAWMRDQREEGVR